MLKQIKKALVLPGFFLLDEYFKLDEFKPTGISFDLKLL